jgi:hypothetical protein
MKIGGHSLRQHLRLLAPLFALLAGVWLLRWIIGCIDTPAWIFHVVSLTVVAPVAVLLAVLMLHVRRFGGYASVVVCSLLLNAWTEVLIVLAVAFSVLTGFMNIYSAPMYSPADVGPHHLRHMRGHLTYGIGISTLAGAAMGSLLLFLLRKLAPMEPRPARRYEPGWKP